MTRVALLTALFLAGCASHPVCEGRLAAVMEQISDREQALARGYRTQPAQDGKTLLRFCGPPDWLCTDPVQQPRAARRVAVDIAEEQSALQQLRAEARALRAEGLTCS